MKQYNYNRQLENNLEKRLNDFFAMRWDWHKTQFLNEPIDNYYFEMI